MNNDRKHLYRINVKLRRRGQPAFDNNRAEFLSEEFDTDEDMCLAVASEMLEQLKDDREYLLSIEGEDEE